MRGSDFGGGFVGGVTPVSGGTVGVGGGIVGKGIRRRRGLFDAAAPDDAGSEFQEVGELLRADGFIETAEADLRTAEFFFGLSPEGSGSEGTHGEGEKCGDGCV